MFNDHIGAEIGISYLLGSRYEAKDEIFSSFSQPSTATYTMSSKMIRFNPSIIITSGIEKINPYAKFGFLIGSGLIDDEFMETTSGDVSELKYRYDGGLAVGFTSSFGGLFELNENMSFFSEINMVNLSYAPTKGEMITANYNGIDMLPNMTTSDKKIDFVDSYRNYYNTPSADSQPSEELRQKYPLGSIGLNIGVMIKF